MERRIAGVTVLHIRLQRWRARGPATLSRMRSLVGIGRQLVVRLVSSRSQARAAINCRPMLRGITARLGRFLPRLGPPVLTTARPFFMGRGIYIAMPIKKNSAGTQARARAVDADTHATYMGIASKVAYGTALAAQGLNAHPATAPLAHPASAILAAAGTAALAKQGMAEASARHGRNRAAALDYAAQDAAFKARKATPRTGDLVRGPVPVTRNGKTFTQSRMVRPDK